MGAGWLTLVAFFTGWLVLGLYELAALWTGLPTISTMLRIVNAHFEPTRKLVERGDAKRALRNNPQPTQKENPDV